MRDLDLAVDMRLSPVITELLMVMNGYSSRRQNDPGDIISPWSDRPVLRLADTRFTP